MAWLTVTPAYGRDYKNQAQVRADWAAGKDFLETVTGRYLSIRDAEKDPDMHVHVRYANLTKLVQVTK